MVCPRSIFYRFVIMPALIGLGKNGCAGVNSLSELQFGPNKWVETGWQPTNELYMNMNLQMIWPNPKHGQTFW